MEQLEHRHAYACRRYHATHQRLLEAGFAEEEIVNYFAFAKYAAAMFAARRLEDKTQALRDSGAMANLALTAWQALHTLNRDLTEYTLGERVTKMDAIAHLIPEPNGNLYGNVGIRPVLAAARDYLKQLLDFNRRLKELAEQAKQNAKGALQGTGNLLRQGYGGQDREQD